MISIIIPIKGDLNIYKTLDRLKIVQKPDLIEILVVYASIESLDFIKNKYPEVNWIKFINTTYKKYTFTEQINLGLTNAKGDYIVFLDSPSIPATDWLIELYKPILKEREKYVTGKTVSINKSIHDINWSKLGDTKYRIDSASNNTIFSRELLEKVGYFDEIFEAGSDVDFAWRAKDAGYKIRYNPKAIIYDDWGNLRQEIKRGIKYGEARVRLYKKHRDKIKNLLDYKTDLFSIYSVLFFIYFISLLPLTYLFNYYPLFLLIPIIRNIKRNPLKKMVYDWFWGMGIFKELLFPYKK